MSGAVCACFRLSVWVSEWVSFCKKIFFVQNGSNLQIRWTDISNSRIQAQRAWFLVFHKTEVQMIILRCLMSLNLNWIISYNINYKFWKIFFLKFKFLKWPFFDHLWSFLDNFIDIFHKIEIQTVILRCLVCLNLNWIKSYDITIG